MNAPGGETTPYDILIEALFRVPIFLVRAEDRRFPMGEMQHISERVTEKWEATTSADDLQRLDLQIIGDFIRSLAQGLESHLTQTPTNPPPGRLDKRDMRNLAYTMSYKIIGLWLNDKTLNQLEELAAPLVRPLIADDYVVPRPAYTHYSDQPGDEDNWADIIDREKTWAAAISDERYQLLREIYMYVSDRMELGLEAL
jgi:hypothetical protein